MQTKGRLLACEEASAEGADNSSDDDDATDSKKCEKSLEDIIDAYSD